jgi:hypothetical protein
MISVLAISQTRCTLNPSVFANWLSVVCDGSDGAAGLRLALRVGFATMFLAIDTTHCRQFSRFLRGLLAAAAIGELNWPKFILALAANRGAAYPHNG